MPKKGIKKKRSFKSIPGRAKFPSLRLVTIVGPELANSPKSDGRVDDPRVLSYRFFAKKRMGELCWSSFLSLLQKARPSNFNKNRLLALRRVGEKAIHTSTIMIDPRTRDLSFLKMLADDIDDIQNHILLKSLKHILYLILKVLFILLRAVW